MRRLTETDRAIEISIVWGIRGEGDWDDDVVKDVSPVVLGRRRRESVEGEGWRSGVAPVVLVDVEA